MSIFGAGFCTGLLVALHWVTICGVTLNLECGQSLKYCPEQQVNLTCAIINATVLRWIIQDDNAETTQLFFTIKDDVGDDPKHRGPFTGRVIGNKTHLLESSLSFTYEEELNNTTVTCERVDVYELDSCSVFGYGMHNSG